MQVNVYEYNNVVSVKYKLKIVWLNIIFKTPRYCYSMIWNWGGDYSFREYTTRVAHPLGNHILAIEREMERWHGIFVLDNLQFINILEKKRLQLKDFKIKSETCQTLSVQRDQTQTPWPGERWVQSFIISRADHHYYMLCTISMFCVKAAAGISDKQCCMSLRTSDMLAWPWHWDGCTPWCGAAAEPAVVPLLCAQAACLH